MSDFLLRLSHRALGSGDLITPRLPSFFAPAPASIPIEAAEEMSSLPVTRRPAPTTSPLSRPVADHGATESAMSNPLAVDAGERSLPDVEIGPDSNESDRNPFPSLRNESPREIRGPLPGGDDRASLPRLLPGDDEPRTSERPASTESIGTDDDTIDTTIDSDFRAELDRPRGVGDRFVVDGGIDHQGGDESPMKLLVPIHHSEGTPDDGIREIASETSGERIGGDPLTGEQPQAAEGRAPRHAAMSAAVPPAGSDHGHTGPRSPAPVAQPAPPTVQVTIGRIEIRATTRQRT